MILLTAYGQQPVNWSYSAKKIADKTFEVHITATIDEGWHIYAQHQPEDGVALPTSFKFNKSPLLIFDGDVEEQGNLQIHKDATLGIQQYQYANKVDFVQVVKLKTKARISVTGSTKFQVCTDEMCMPPAITNFNIALEEDIAR